MTVTSGGASHRSRRTAAALSHPQALGRCRAINPGVMGSNTVTGGASDDQVGAVRDPNQSDSRHPLHHETAAHTVEHVAASTDRQSPAAAPVQLAGWYGHT